MSNSPQKLHSSNQARCERLVERAGLLDTDGIAWEWAPAHALHAEAVACLVYMRDVEGFTNRDLVGLSGHPATPRRPPGPPVPGRVACRGS